MFHLFYCFYCSFESFFCLLLWTRPNEETFQNTYFKILHFFHISYRFIFCHHSCNEHWLIQSWGLSSFAAVILQMLLKTSSFLDDKYKSRNKTTVFLCWSKCRLKFFDVFLFYNLIYTSVENNSSSVHWNGTKLFSGILWNICLPHHISVALNFTDVHYLRQTWC